VALMDIANAYFDIPHLVFNAPPTPFNWAEVIFEILLIFIVGLTIGLMLARLLTRQKQVEEALLDSEEQYRLLQEHASEGIMVIQDGIIKFANPRAARLLAYPNSELYSRQFIEIVHADDRKAAISRYLAAISSKNYRQLTIPTGSLLKGAISNGRKPHLPRLFGRKNLRHLF